MGRYFQEASWPGADFELALITAAVPDTLIRFHSSGGVHLLHYHCIATNDGLAVAQITTELELDGGPLSATDCTARLLVGESLTFQATALIEIAAGPHTLQLVAAGVNALGDVIAAGQGILLAVEFPSWETSDRIEAG